MLFVMQVAGSSAKVNMQHGSTVRDDQLDTEGVTACISSRLTHRHTHTQTERQTDRHTNRETQTQRDRETPRETETLLKRPNSKYNSRHFRIGSLQSMPVIANGQAVAQPLLWTSLDQSSIAIHAT